MMISEMFDSKDGKRHMLTLYPCDAVPSVSVDPNGIGILEGNYDQFRELYDILKMNFDFDEEED